MKILLSSASMTVLKRWNKLLAEGGTHNLEQAPSFRELEIRAAQNSYGLILVHRSLVDRELFSKLIASSTSNRFFLLSDRPDEEEGLDFLKQGIVGYANTYISQARLLEAVRTVSNGSVWVGQKVIQLLIAEVHSWVTGRGVSEKEERLADLTKREREIARLIAEGRSNVEIAAHLNITERTVKAHLTSIYEKTKTGNRLSLALLVNQR